MSKRHETIGIKQIIRFEWMQKTTNLLLAGLDTQTILQELHEFLADRKSNGSKGERSDETRAFAVINLMNIWVSPNPELIPFRDALLAFLRKHPSMAMVVHWGMISAVYPFWFNAARQTGRLLSLQDQVTQAQIFNRLKEQYGDRQTVSRCARYVLRTFVVWGALKDSKVRGCYEKVDPVSITDAELAILMLESALLATPEAKSTLVLLLNNPAFFPFQLPIITGSFVSQHSDQIDVDRYGLDDELLTRRFSQWERSAMSQSLKMHG